MTKFSLQALVVKLVIGGAFALSLSGQVEALQFKRSGDAIIISGGIRQGDEFAFMELINNNGAGVRYAHLNSSGGHIQTAVLIGRELRRRGITTVVDAARSNCASACTVLFASGVQRIYRNAGGISDGVTGLSGRGLGYHEGNNKLSLDANKYSGRATAGMISAYYEFGSSGATSIITKAGPKQLYRISGATAASLGLATSLQ